MTRKLFILLLPFLAFKALAQNPTTVFQLPQKTFIVPCGSACITITARVPHIKQSDEYTVKTIPYQPFAYSGAGTELTALYVDDLYTNVINLPFPVCFYGSLYNSLVVGSNGVVSFDVTNAGKRNNFRQTVSFSNTTPVRIPFAGGTQNSLASTYFPKAAIMGVYHDIFPSLNNGTRRIEWRLEGVAPKRRFIASYKDVPMYGLNCTDLTATHQMVVYESTGVVEVYVQDKPVCTAWNEGLAILGLQNFARNKAAFPQGKNAGRWGGMGMNEAIRFTPAAGTARFKKAELLSGGIVLAIADTATAPDGELDLNFAAVCPVQDSADYSIRVTYQACNGTADEVSFDDTIIIKKETLAASVQTINPTCTTGGSIAVTATGTTAQLLYRLNGGTPQASPVFTDLPAGEYTITVSGGGACEATASANLTLLDDLLLVAQPTAAVCAGEAFTPSILSNAGSFNWSPAAGVSNAAEAHPEIQASQSTVYTLTAIKGVCQKTAILDVTVKPLPSVNAGADKTIIQGDKTELTTTASAGTVEWSPVHGLSSAVVPNPSAIPLNTTTYKLTVSNNGCSASDDVTVTVVPYCVKPMEAFSPNGDGINDLWLVTTGTCLQQAKVDVFNRYGAKVFQHNDYKNNWNGTFDGKPLPDGTYYYIITYQLINGKTVYQKGNVTILR
jgi:gliding motility-associated-like protein